MGVREGSCREVGGAADIKDGWIIGLMAGLVSVTLALRVVMCGE
jgi:hypothetical protein